MEKNGDAGRRSHLIFGAWSILVGLALMCSAPTFVHATISSGTPNGSDAELTLERAETLKSADNAEFQRLLAQLDLRASTLPKRQQQHLQYLHAWQHVYEGDLKGASRMLVPVIAQNSDPILRFRATASLIDVLGATHHYVEAFQYLDGLMAQLPGIHDKAARFQGLGEAAQLLNLAGQYDLAIQYAGQMVKDLPPGESVCRGEYHALYAKYRSGATNSADPAFSDLAAICDQAGQHLFADSLRADVADMLIKEGHAHKALTLLKAHLVEVQRVGFPFLSSQFNAILGKAYQALGDLGSARSHALRAIQVAGNESQYEPLSMAYQVLFQIEEQQGNYFAALGWHKKYMQADAGYLNDISARALAFQRVKQQVDARKQQVDTLHAQNRILQLQQALDRKAALTSQLSIVLLLTVLASVIFWLIRLKRSQKRFMRMAHHDGLTGIFNRQHFVEQAERMLASARKEGTSVCLILLDLDHFKLINDSHGHAIGDLVLKRAVAMCHDQLRKYDIFGRLGGEEFGILLPDCSLERVNGRAEAIRDTIASTSLEDDAPGVTVSASLGVASTEQAGYDLRQLMADADNALYRAKHAGRNRVVVDGLEQLASSPTV